MKILIEKKAENTLRDIARYIFSKSGFSNRAVNYIIKMRDFINSLASFPERYPLCRKISFRMREYRCAPYDEYVIVYRINNDELLIINVIHSKRLV